MYGKARGWCQMPSSSSFYLNRFLRQCLWIILDVTNLSRLTGQQSLEMTLSLLPTYWYSPLHISWPCLFTRVLDSECGRSHLPSKHLIDHAIFPTLVSAVLSMCKVITGYRYNWCTLISSIPRKHYKCIYLVSFSYHGICKLHATQTRSMTSLYSPSWEHAVWFSGLSLCFVIIFSSKLPFWSIFLFKSVSLGHLLVIFQYLIFFEKTCILSLFPNHFPLEQLQNK